jgi:hypothetical protein
MTQSKYLVTSRAQKGRMDDSAGELKPVFWDAPGGEASAG